jgi:hypothetical protein
MVIDFEARCYVCTFSIYAKSGFSLFRDPRGVRARNVDSLEPVTSLMVHRYGPRRPSASPKLLGRQVCSMATIEVRSPSPVRVSGLKVPSFDGKTNPWIRFLEGWDAHRIMDRREAM